MLLFAAANIQLGYGTMLLAHVAFCVPYVVLSVMPKLRQLDPNLAEAAWDLGATPWQGFFRVILPDIMPGVFSGFILSITLSLDDYIITAFTRDTAFQTLSTYVYGVTSKKGSLPPSLRALTTVITLIALIILTLFHYMILYRICQGGNVFFFAFFCKKKQLPASGGWRRQLSGSMIGRNYSICQESVRNEDAGSPALL
jgi:spermidine/putrescine transport system permease protein